MKLAVTVASEYSKPETFAVLRGFENGIVKASEMGYDGIELVLVKPEEVNLKVLKKLMIENNMKIPGISTGPIFKQLNLYFTSPDKEIRRKTLDVFKEIVVIASELNSVVNIGRVCGFIEKNENFQIAEERLINSINEILHFASLYNVELVIEPVNRYESNFINKLDQAAKIIEKLSFEGCSIMPDLFHMNIEEISIIESIKNHIHKIKYIHFADSNRLAPGEGHLDFSPILEVLKSMKYDGWISAEILPLPDPDTAALQAVKYLLPRIKI